MTTTKVTAVVSKNTNHVSLVQGNVYILIGIETDSYRVIDESSEPTLFPKTYFLEEEVTPLSEWIYQKYDEDEYTYNMPQFSSRGFLKTTQTTLNKQLKQWMNLEGVT